MNKTQTSHPLKPLVKKPLWWFLTATLTVLSCSQTVLANNLIDRVAAVVNNQVILKSELNDQMYSQQQSLAAQGIAQPSADVLQEKVLDSLILEKLQLERAATLGIEIPDETINEQLETIAKQNNMDLIALRKRLNLETPDGFGNLRQQIKDKFLIQKVREAEVLSQTHITESEIQNYLTRQSLDDRQEKLHLGHILIEIPESATPQQRQTALQKAEEIYHRITLGEEFSQLAVRYSDGSKALNGGSLGWFERAEVPTFFADPVSKLAIGEVSDIIQSPSGFHIIKLIDQQGSNTNLNKSYHLHRFLMPSEQALQQPQPTHLLALSKSLNSIEDFKALKNQFPEIPAEINENSDLGWATIEEIPEGLQNEVLNLKANQALEPLATEQGWMILFLEEIKILELTEDDRKQQAIKEIRMRKANETFELWLRRLKDEAFIEIRLDSEI